MIELKSTMNNGSYTGENEYDLSFLIAGIYLVLVGVTGGFFNIIAFVKVWQVKYVINFFIFRALIIHKEINHLAIIFYTF